MNKIVDYLVNERKQKHEVAMKIVAPLEKHDDIRSELEYWLEKREYLQDNPIVIEGYSAKDIIKLAPFMDGVGVYNFMITLRERPESGKKIIADGFKRK
ncbi:MAG: hypothetical protein LBC71_06060 [Oscillospiraceae bacterium]|jgi:hypothetical protein|nr:hypothetical protein [Oscillospiraceae bacterium]